MFICIEGVIGVGKSSLTKLLSDSLKMQEVYEIVEENPYLSDFYTNKDQVAFQTEMFFLTHRYGQLKEINSLLQQGDVVTDYSIFKNLLFAQENLADEELSYFNEIFTILTRKLPNPDLIIFLKADLNTLKHRIALRNRTFEQVISDDYLNNLNNYYEGYIQQLRNDGKEVLVVDCSELDFVNNSDDRANILALIEKKIKEVNNV